MSPTWEGNALTSNYSMDRFGSVRKLLNSCINAAPVAADTLHRKAIYMQLVYLSHVTAGDTQLSLETSFGFS